MMSTYLWKQITYCFFLIYFFVIFIKVQKSADPTKVVEIPTWLWYTNRYAGRNKIYHEVRVSSYVPRSSLIIDNSDPFYKSASMFVRLYEYVPSGDN